MKNYVKDNKTGKLSTLIKNKPVDVPVKGRIKLELINAETGEVEVEAKSENIFMNWPYKNAYNAGIFSCTSRRTRASAPSDSSRVGVPCLIGTLRLTTNTLPEHADCPLVLGKQIGWSPLDYTYVGDDKAKGTINTAETTHYWNNDGQYVMSMVCDWPTHAANGTFQSIFITMDEDVNYTRDIHSGRVICNLRSVPTEYKKAFVDSNSRGRWVTRYNEILDEVILIGFNGSNSNADYKSKINIFRFNGETGEYEDFIQLKDETGTPINAYFYDSSSSSYTGEAYSNNLNHQNNFHYLDNGEVLGLCFDGSKLIKRTFNSEGIFKNDKKEVLLTDILDSNEGRLYVNYSTSSHNHCSTAFRIYGDGTIHLYGNFRPKDNYYENVIVIFNKNLELQDIVYVNNDLYPDWVTVSPAMKYWQTNASSSSQSRDMIRMTTGAGTFTYLITKEGKLKYLSDFGYNGGVVGGDFSISGLDTANGNSTGRKSYRFNRVSTHTLLAAPVTKTQSHTMKVTYEVISEPSEVENTKNFTDFLLEQI